MKRILKLEQKTYLILGLAMDMRDECAGKEELKADYQIAARIYSNAFANMIRYGFPPSCEARDGMAFLTMELEGCTYSCPARTVKNILKSEFAIVEESVPEAAAMVAEEEARIAAESKNKKREKQDATVETGQAAAQPVKKPEAQKPETRKPEVQRPMPALVSQAPKAPKTVQAPCTVQTALPKPEGLRIPPSKEPTTAPAARKAEKAAENNGKIEQQNMAVPGKVNAGNTVPVQAEKKIQAAAPAVPATQAQPVQALSSMKLTPQAEDRAREAVSIRDEKTPSAMEPADMIHVSSMPDPAPGPLPQPTGYGRSSGASSEDGRSLRYLQYH